MGGKEGHSCGAEEGGLKDKKIPADEAGKKVALKLSDEEKIITRLGEPMDEYEDKREAQSIWDREHGAGQVAPAGQTNTMYDCARPATIKEMQDMRLEQALRRLEYYPPTGDQPTRYQVIRDAAKALITVIIRNCPLQNHDTEQAIELIEASVMVANKAIATS